MGAALKVVENGRIFTVVDLYAEDKKTLIEKISKYFKEYPPAGYGTRVIREPYKAGDKWVCRVDRFSSCD